MFGVRSATPVRFWSSGQVSVEKLAAEGLSEAIKAIEFGVLF